jgi:hypothetical protein
MHMSMLITLGDLAGKTLLLDVECKRCHRRGKINMEARLALHGPDCPLRRIVEPMNSSCPRYLRGPVYQRCDVRFPGLAELTRLD